MLKIYDILWLKIYANTNQLFAESKMSTFLVKDVGHSVKVTNKKQTN